MAFHLPEIADFFTEKDLSQIVDRAKNDALKNKQKVLWVKNSYSKFFHFYSVAMFANFCIYHHSIMTAEKSLTFD